MSSIGPQIPPHLLKQLNASSSNDDDDDEQGPQPSTSTPQIPAHLNSTSIGSSEKELQVFDEDVDEDDGPQFAPAGPSIGPTLPPEFQRTLGPTVSSSSSRPVAGPSVPRSSSTTSRKGPIGPSLPPGVSSSAYDDESDDDDIGPKPLPASLQQQHNQHSDAVREFLEREEKRRKAAEEAAKPKAPKREEWMLVPPTTAGLLGNLDPTKLKARQFSTSTHSTASSKQDTSLWTETPQERQQRLADEVTGKKRRVTDAPPQEEEDEKARKRRRKQEESAIRRGVEEHTRKARGAALVDQHKSTLAKKPSNAEDSEVPGIWDHSRDMALGGRLMDDEKRNKMLKEAKGLGDRFGSGKSGGFL